MSAPKEKSLFNKLLPSDFDGKDYLDLNQDVRDANMDPLKHYLNYGWKENRLYKKPFSICRKESEPRNSAKKSVLIHIGLGRCGTSSLQFALHSCRENFSKAKVFYPKTMNGQTAHHELAPHMPDEIRRACEYWNEISEEFEVGDYEMLLLSSEMFAECPDALLNHISVLFEKYEVKIFFFGKAQQRLLPSIYSHWSSVGVGFRSFRSFYNLTKNEWNFTRILQRWSDKFGIHNICCQILREGDDSLEIFAKVFSQQTKYLLTSNKIEIRFNESLPRVETNILKIFDQLSHPLSFHKTFPGWDRIEQDVRDRNTWLRSRLLTMIRYTGNTFPRHSRSLLNINDRQEIHSFYYNSNQEFHKIYLGGQSCDWFSKL